MRWMRGSPLCLRAYSYPYGCAWFPMWRGGGAFGVSRRTSSSLSAVQESQTRLVGGEDPFALQEVYEELMSPQKSGFRINDVYLSWSPIEEEFVAMMRSVDENDPTRKQSPREMYNTLLRVQAAHRRADLALQTMRQMETKGGVGSDIRSYTALLSACATSGDVALAEQSWNRMKERHIEQMEKVWNELVTRTDLRPDTVMYTSRILGYFRRDQHPQCWKIYQELINTGLAPDTVTYSLMISVCAKEEKAEKAWELYSELQQSGFEPTPVTFNTLIQVCSRREDYFSQAFEIYREMRLHEFLPDIYTYNALLNACARRGDSQFAVQLFEAMRQEIEPTLESFNVLFFALSNNNPSLWRGEFSSDKPLMLLSDTNMQSESFASKESELGEMDEFNHDGDCRGADVHDTSPKLSVPREKQIQVLVSQADAYYQSLLHEYRFSPNVYTLSNFLSVFAQHLRLGRAREVIRSFRDWNLAPDAATDVIVVKMLSRARRLKELKVYLDDMKQRGSTITPPIVHHLAVLSCKLGEPFAGLICFDWLLSTGSPVQLSLLKLIQQTTSRMERDIYGYQRKRSRLPESSYSSLTGYISDVLGDSTPGFIDRIRERLEERVRFETQQTQKARSSSFAIEEDFKRFLFEAEWLKSIISENESVVRRLILKTKDTQVLLDSSSSGSNTGSAVLASVPPPSFFEKPLAVKSEIESSHFAPLGPKPRGKKKLSSSIRSKMFLGR